MNLHGNPQIREMTPRRKFRPGRGWSTVRVYDGTEDAINAFLPTVLSENGGFVEVDIDQGDSLLERRLSVTIPDAQDGSAPDDDANTIISWAMPTAVEQRDLFDHPRFAALDAADQDALVEYRKDTSDGNYPALTGDGEEFADAVKAKQEDYIFPIIVLRRTVTLPRGGTVGNLVQYVAKVFTRAQVISIFDPPANYVAQMPSGGGAGEWLCTVSELNDASDGRAQIVQEFTHGLDISFLYTRWT